MTVAARQVKDVKGKTQDYAVRLKNKKKPSSAETRLYRQQLAEYRARKTTLKAQQAKAVTPAQKRTARSPH